MKYFNLFPLALWSFLISQNIFAKNSFYDDLSKIQRKFVPGILNYHLKRDLSLLEKKYGKFLSLEKSVEAMQARKKFQYYCSQSQYATNLKIEMPDGDTPFWQRMDKQYTNYQSTFDFPQQTDILIIGGGLTGTSIAYHLGKKLQEYYLDCANENKKNQKEQKLELFTGNSNLVLKQKYLHACKSAKKVYQQTLDTNMALKVAFSVGPRVTLLDTMDLVQQASGRNGGNIHSIPEVFFGNYENIVKERYKFIKNLWPLLDEQSMQQKAYDQAMAIINMAKWTRKLIGEIPLEEGFDADFSPGGWLRIATSDQELEGLKYEAELLKLANLPSKIYSPMEIEKKWHYRPSFGGRFTSQDATYHPYKFAMGMIHASVEKFNLQIYTRTKVMAIEEVKDAQEEITLETSRGKIKAAKVVLATNAFTRFLVNYKHIKPVLSQIMATDFLPDKTQGSLITEEQGYIYYHQPKGSITRDKRTGKQWATLLMGGPDVQLSQTQMDDEYYIYNMQPIKWVHEAILNHRNKVFPEYKNVPPSAQWAGPMGFTPDRIPSIGVYAKNIFMAAGFNGYGGTYTIGAGKSLAKLILTGKSSSKVNLEMFDPLRFEN